MAGKHTQPCTNWPGCRSIYTGCTLFTVVPHRPSSSTSCAFGEDLMAIVFFSSFSGFPSAGLRFAPPRSLTSTETGVASFGPIHCRWSVEWLCTLVWIRKPNAVADHCVDLAAPYNVTRILVTIRIIRQRDVLTDPCAYPRVAPAGSLHPLFK